MNVRALTSASFSAALALLLALAFVLLVCSFQSFYASAQPMSTASESKYDENCSSLKREHMLELFRNTLSNRYLPVVLPTKKILYCLIPKTGSTSFLGFLRRLEGYQDWGRNPHFLSVENDTSVNQKAKKAEDRFHWYGLHSLMHLDKPKICEAMLSNSWTRVIVVRDPALRLLSAWRDKIHDLGYTEAGLENLMRIFQVSDQQALQEIGFIDFVDFLYQNRHRPDVYDVHWLPQVEFCGLRFFAKAYNHIIRVEQIAKDTKRFLQTIGYWEQIGKNYTGDGKDIFERNLSPHAHNQSKSDIQQYLTPAVLAQINEIYREDYSTLLGSVYLPKKYF